MYKYESMALIIRDYLSTLSDTTVQLTALEARKLPGMDEFAPNSCYENVGRAMERVAIAYYKGNQTAGKFGSSTFTYEYRLK